MSCCRESGLIEYKSVSEQQLICDDLLVACKQSTYYIIPSNQHFRLITPILLVEEGLLYLRYSEQHVRTSDLR